MRLAIMLLLILAAGCTCNCDDDKGDARKKYGNPEEVTSYHSRGYTSTTWWWWSKGISKTFKSGKHITGCCEVSTFTFTPLSSAPVDTVGLALERQEDEISWRGILW